MKKNWERLAKGIEALSKWSGRLSGALLIPLTLAVSYTAVMRRFGNSPDWGFEVGIFLYGIPLILAGADVLRKNEHVTVDIVPQLLSARPRQLLAVFSMVVVILVCLVLLVEGTITAWGSTLIDEHSSHQSSFNPPIWWYRWFLPIAAFLLLLQAVKHLGDILLSGTEEKENARG